MPTLPATDGLPVWAQVLVSILVCIATLAVALKGYFGKSAPPTDGAPSGAITFAMLREHGAITHNSDALVQLSANVLALTTGIHELTHHERNGVEVTEELCARLRGLTEVLERQARDVRDRDDRDESRRGAGRRID